MGMAASQARLIELCARKSNVEYEGQQINQERVNLANESAGLFNQLMSLDVPTPPSTSDYTTTTYTFSDGITKYTIDKISKKSDSAEYNATITYYSNVTNYTGLQKEKNTLDINKKIDPEGNVFYYYGTTKLSDYYSSTDDTALEQISQDLPDSLVAQNFLSTANVTEGTNPDNTTWKLITDANTGHYTKITYFANGNTKSINTWYDPDNCTQIDYDIMGIPSYSGTIDGTVLVNPTKDDMLKSVPIDYDQRKDKIKSYQQGGKTYYISMDQFDEATAVTQQPVQSCYACDYTTKEYVTTEAYIENAESGRYSQVTLPGFSTSMQLDTATYTDENAYNDAMNEYSYQQQVYEKQVQDINAKTEIIQQEDRTLELKLKQLDTEHNALQTEMDAVKKVIDKNVESTFKTFS